MTKESKNIIIHIGFPKTATTWLQKNFFPKVQNYEYFLPRVSNDEIIGVDPMDPLYNPGKWKQKDNIIISNENFLGVGRISGFIRIGLANRLKEIFPEAHIVLFIRNQIDLIGSEYSWSVKNAGCTFGPEKFLRFKNPHWHNAFAYKPHHLMFDRVINLYKQLFGDEHVHVFLYENLKENPKKFIERFSGKLGMEVNTETVDYNPVNTKLRKRLLPIIRFLNIFTKPKILFRHHFISLPYLGELMPKIAKKLNSYSAFGKKQDSADLLGSTLTNELSSFYKESNQKLINEHGLSDIKKYNYPL